MKIKVSVFTFLLVILAFFSHFLVPLLHIFFIMTLHEAGHALWAIAFKFPVRKVEILPFGLAMTLEDFGNRDALKEIVILAGGLAVHLLIPFLYDGLAAAGLVSSALRQWILIINQSVFLFNSLPLYPLDGGRIVLSLLHFMLPYTRAEQLSGGLSLLLIPVIFVRLMNHSPATLMVFVFLTVMNLLYLRALPWQRRQFYLFRYFHPCTLSVKIHAHQDLYRQHSNVIVTHGVPLLEPEWILKTFHGSMPERKDGFLERMI